MPQSHEMKTISLQEAARHEFELDGHTVGVWVAPEGYANGVYGRNRSKGHFNAVVEFGHLMIDRNMSGSVVPEEQRWKKGNLPGGVEILEFDDNVGPEVSRAADGIEEVANGHGAIGFLDPVLTHEYFLFDKAIAQHQLPPREHQWIPVGIRRVGMPALDAAGFPYSKQVVIDEKRLDRRNKSGNIMHRIGKDMNSRSSHIHKFTGFVPVAVPLLHPPKICNLFYNGISFGRGSKNEC